MTARARAGTSAGTPVWLVVGDLKKVEAGIRELNLGDVLRLDESGKSTN